MSATVTIRPATASDADAVERLAALDSTSAPPGDVLLAEVGDELWAAVEIDGGRAIADPFRASRDLVELLRLRADGMRAERPRPSRRLRLIPRAA
jgi:hypothetical protein